MRTLWSRFAALFRAERLDRDLDDEVGFHLAMLEDEFRARGMGPTAATLAARREFGGVPQTSEAYREPARVPWLEIALERRPLRATRPCAATPVSRPRRCFRWRSASAPTPPFSRCATPDAAHAAGCQPEQMVIPLPHGRVGPGVLVRTRSIWTLRSAAICSTARRSFGGLETAL